MPELVEEGASELAGEVFGEGLDLFTIYFHDKLISGLLFIVIC